MSDYAARKGGPVHYSSNAYRQQAQPCSQSVPTPNFEDMLLGMDGSSDQTNQQLLTAEEEFAFPTLFDDPDPNLELGFTETTLSTEAYLSSTGEGNVLSKVDDLFQGTGAGIEKQQSQLALAKPWNQGQPSAEPQQPEPRQSASSYTGLPNQPGKYTSRSISGSNYDSNFSTKDSGYVTQPPIDLTDSRYSAFQVVTGPHGHRYQPSVDMSVMDATSTYQDTDSVVENQQYLTNKAAPSVESLQCPYCGKSFKTKSGFKKHINTHIKPHKCIVHGCPRSAEGFATSNDRDRHILAVHHTYVEGSNLKLWRCFAPNCKSKDNIWWARHDNFEKHVLDSHGGPASKEHWVTLSDAWWEANGMQYLAQCGKIITLSPAPDPTSDFQPSPSDAQTNDLHTDLSVSTTPSPLVAMSRSFSHSYVNPSHTQYIPEMAEPAYYTATSLPMTGYAATIPRLPSSGNTLAQALSFPPAHDLARKRSHNWSSGQAPKRQRRPTSGEVQNFRRMKGGNHDLGSSPLVESTQQLRMFGFSIPSNHASISKRPMTVAGGEALAHNSGVFNGRTPVPKYVQQPLEDLSAMGEGAVTMADDSHQAYLTDDSVNLNNVPPITLTLPQDELTEHSHSGSNKPSVNGKEDLLWRLRKCKSLITEEEIRAITTSLESTSSTRNAVRSSARSQNLKISLNASTSPLKKLQCQFCGKFKKRPSDLKKHEDRHKKIYWCTFKDCYSRAGTKSDWRRHEHGKHMQDECWRCYGDKDVVNGRPCRRICKTSHEYLAHLDKDHNVTDTARQADLSRERHVARRNAGSFWCGFCKSIISSRYRGIDADVFRFNHIEEHFKQKPPISTWEELEGEGVTKQAMLDSNEALSTSQAGTPSPIPFGDEDDGHGDDTASSSSHEDQDPAITTTTITDTDTSYKPQLSFNPNPTRSRHNSTGSCSTISFVPQGLGQNSTSQLSVPLPVRKRKRTSPYDQLQPQPPTTQMLSVPNYRFGTCCSCRMGNVMPAQLTCSQCTHMLCSGCFKSTSVGNIS